MIGQTSDKSHTLVTNKLNISYKYDTILVIDFMDTFSIFVF